MSSVTSPPAPGSTPATLRSIASPAHLRSAFAKASPLGHALGASFGGVNMSRVPTGASETGTNGSSGAFDAHAALMEKTGLTPAGMGLGMTPPGGGQLGAGGTLSGLGISNVKEQEDEGRKKTEEIVSTIGTRWGRVCQEGLERAAKRVGLECLWEEGRAGKRTLSIAGNGVLIDVEFNMEDVKNVTLEFAGSRSEVGKRAAQGAMVLKRDLKGEEEGNYVTLDAFVGNLERLAKMDKLSEGGINCFDVLEGIRGALQTVFDFEVGKTRAEKGSDEAKEAIDRKVLCRASGRPMVHTGGRVGLTLQYWMDRHLLLSATQEPEAMDIDTDSSPCFEQSGIYSAILETEATPSSIYPPIRVSNSWLGSPVERPAPTEPDPFLEHTSSINWEEPPLTYISLDSTDQQDALPNSKTPNVRFIARFEPPLVIPLQTAADIYQSVGAPLAQDTIQPTTYESLLFADATTPPGHSGQRIATKRLTSYDATGEPTEHFHRYTLFALQPDYSRVIDAIPFSHPRQLIAVLPLLRQWALIGSLLRRSFVPEPLSLIDAATDAIGTTDVDLDIIVNDQEMTVEEELAALLDDNGPSAPSPQDDKENALTVDITLCTTSLPPRIGVVWSRGDGLRSVDFGVGLNGVIEASPGNEGDGGQTSVERERLSKILSISEDVGVLIEWLSKDT
ncbi:MAG: hypothetical protein Q9195_003799 [Heterodermia aff. obscurata]